MKSLFRFKKFVPGVIGAISLVAVGLWFGMGQSEASAGGGIAQYSLTPQDLPQGSQAFALGPSTIKEENHPLGLGINSDGTVKAFGAEKTAIYQYSEAYSFGAILPDGVVIASFTYRYQGSVQAEQAVAAFVSDLASNKTVVRTSVDASQTGLKGNTVVLTGAEGDVVYWFVANRDNVVSIVMANGFDDSIVNREFLQAVQRVSQK